MDNLFHQPQGGNEMPRFAGRATMMRLPFIEDLQDLTRRLSAFRWISAPRSARARATDHAIFAPNR